MTFAFLPGRSLLLKTEAAGRFFAQECGNPTPVCGHVRVPLKASRSRAKTASETHRGGGLTGPPPRPHFEWAVRSGRLDRSRSHWL
jgi:hypothetical protein